MQLSFILFKLLFQEHISIKEQINPVIVNLFQFIV